MSPDENDEQVMQVSVTNHNGFPVKDMFDGVEYLFERGIPKSLPIDAAHHIFGWFPTWVDEDGKEHKPDPAEMRRHTQKRFGWNTPEYAGGKGDLFYDAITIKPIRYRMVAVDEEEAEAPEAETVPAVNKPVSRNKVLAAADYAAQQRQ